MIKPFESDSDLNYMRRAVHGSEQTVEKDVKSEQMLDKLEKLYPKVFSEPTYPVWHDKQPFQISLVDETKQPARRRLYHLSQAELAELKKQITTLTESGRIVPSQSLYGHPVLFAEKKGRCGQRLCIDCRSLNANTVNDAWPLLRIDELLSRLQGTRIFSKQDLRDGYHQIPVDPLHRHKTAFVCLYGAFEYTVMTFGFKNAPAHF